MSNRRRPLNRKRVIDAARCPDCNSTVTVNSLDQPAGLSWLDVAHDDTCPWFQAHGAREFRALHLVSRRHIT